MVLYDMYEESRSGSKSYDKFVMRAPLTTFANFLWIRSPGLERIKNEASTVGGCEFHYGHSGEFVCVIRLSPNQEI